ncbi:hypothetical protein CC86DRAFT_368757 [Ophiobolus disseminans]|uniref:Pullulan synthetase n=1 Tax=Ophiobolus disseminans TaxID=1469910 RepID=A0A6A7A7H4_9PLEO|nr:hypothetical protein CC86DRAFT_368757 [Ophiobolus disseminans]
MRSSTLSLIVAVGAMICAAFPTELTNFLLVTTSQADPNPDPSELQAVAATSLYDPFHQPALILRLIGSGYNSLPNFTLTDGTLSSVALAPFNGGEKLYNSTIVEAGKELQFLASPQPAGNMALSEGYLLTVDGEEEGWTICNGLLGSEVLTWKGTTDGCADTYVHAVTKAPY